MLSVLIPKIQNENEQNKNKGKETREHKETFGDGYVYYLNGGDSFGGVFICPNSSNCTHCIWAIICIYQLYHIKAIQKANSLWP